MFLRAQIASRTWDITHSEPFRSCISEDSQKGVSLGLKYDSIGIAPAWIDSGRQRGSNKPIKGLPTGTALYEPMSGIYLEQAILVPYAFLRPKESAGQVRSLLSSAYITRKSRGTDPDKETAPLTPNELEKFALLIATT